MMHLILQAFLLPGGLLGDRVEPFRYKIIISLAVNHHCRYKIVTFSSDDNALSLRYGQPRVLLYKNEFII